MGYEPPTHPTDIPVSLIDRLDALSPDELRDLATYAEALAEHNERERRLAEEEDDSQPEIDDPKPESVPDKATVVTKTINDNEYYYWQWREGEQIKSEYIKPVTPKR